VAEMTAAAQTRNRCRRLRSCDAPNPTFEFRQCVGMMMGGVGRRVGGVGYSGYERGGASVVRGGVFDRRLGWLFHIRRGQS